MADRSVPAGYTLIDAGLGRKLERLGDHLVDRQAPPALWRPTLGEGEWKKVEGRHLRSKEGGGRWEWRTKPPEEWTIRYGELNLLIRPTPFGHVGFFAEQAAQWHWLRAAVGALKASLGRAPKILNLFAYTGGSTLACAQAGASVTHVDAARGIVDWARRNAELNDLADREIRWIVDDCLKFVQRESRRGQTYDGVILDPPSFGRGAKGEVWKIEDDLPPLLDECALVTQKAPGLLLFSCHSEGYTPLALPSILGDFFKLNASEIEAGEMSVEIERSKRPLPAGFFLRAAKGLPRGST